MWGSKKMLKETLNEFNRSMYIAASMDGIGIIVLGIVLELLLRLGMYFKYINSGMEWFLFQWCSIVGCILVVFNIITLWFKFRKIRKR